MFRLFSLTIVGLVLIYAIESAVLQKFITGKVTHKGQNNIDKSFKAQVELRDVSLMDVASKLIGSTVISDAKTFPVSYKLSYNPSDIKPGHTYSMSARITGPGDKLQYSNDVHTAAELTGAASPVIDIPVIRVGKGKIAKRSLNAVCNQPKVPGLCRKSLPRFYYKSATRRCEEFTYSGCGGNGNNFNDRNSCEQACKA